MKKAIPVIAVLIIAAVVFYFINSSTSLTGPTATQPKTAKVQTSTPSSPGGENSVVVQPGTADTKAAKVDGESDTEESEAQEKSALESYKTADDAFKAIRAGAVDFDDRILEQFTELGEDCSWCDQVYTQVKEMMLTPETPAEQRSYYAELLAVSGRVSNVTALVDAIKAAPNQETADSLSEALELTVGKNDVTQYLGDQLSTSGDSLKESLVAALTNQGTRLAADILYKATVEKGDPDGFYALGIGLGELVPDESSMPYLQELALKRDQYSHLAIKSMLNGGIDGLKLVMNTITNSPNPEFDQKMLKDAIDHVPYDDDTRDYLNKIIDTSKDPLAVKFAKDIVESMKSTDTNDSTDSTEEEAPMSTQPPTASAQTGAPAQPKK